MTGTGRSRIVNAMLAVAFGGLLAASSVGAGQAPSITISGRILDDARQPLAGVKVTCYVDTYNEAVRDFDGILIGQTVTQADGAYSFKAAATSESYRRGSVIAEKAGCALAYASWRMMEDQQTDLVLGVPQTLAGVVVDEDGRPVAQATVGISVLRAWADPEDPGLSRTVTPKVLAVDTDAKGRFAFRNLPAGATAEFVVKKAGRASIDTYDRQADRSAGYTYAVGRADISLVQPVEARIEGIVVNKDTGRPVSGVQLRVIEVGVTPLATHDLITSGQDGAFTIDALPAGPHVVQLVGIPPREGMSEWVGEPLSVTVEAGQTLTGVKMEIGKGGIVEVKVTDAADNRPIPGATIGLEYSGRDLRGSGVSDANGLARIRLLPGTYQLRTAYASGYASERRDQTVTVSAGQTRRLSLTLRSRPKVTGVIRDQEGQPVAGAQVTIIPHVSASDVFSDTDGRYELNWDPGSWPEMDTPFCLLVRHVQRNLAAALELGRDTKKLDVRMQPGVILGGKVVDPDGRGIAGARVTPMLRLSSLSVSMTRERIETQPDGSFTVAALPRDQRYNISASADGYGSARSDVEADRMQGERATIEALTLPVANLSISGEVVDVEGRPLAGVRLSGYGQEQPDRVTARTGSEGRFLLKQVCSGQISLQANIVREGQRLSGRMVTEGGATGVRIIVREGRPPVQYHSGKTYEQIVASSDKLITGVAVDERGAPVANVPVGVCCIKRIREDGRMSWMFSSFNTLKATTDQEGRFAIALEEEAQYCLLFSPDNYAATIVYDIPLNKKDLKVTLEDGGTLEGRVMRLERGVKVPVPNAEVKLEQESRASYTHLGFDRDRTILTDDQGRFRFEHIQTGIRPSNSRADAEWTPVPRVWKLSHGDTTETLAFSDGKKIEDFELLIKPSIDNTAPLVGNRLPSFEGIAIDLDPEQSRDKAILLCFFDYQQRPSRNTVQQLATQADSLRQKGVVVAAVQASQVQRAALDAWAAESHVPFPLGIITGDVEVTRAMWCVKSLPWLILTDKNHIVQAEGFTIAELNDKIDPTEHKSQ